MRLHWISALLSLLFVVILGKSRKSVLIGSFNIQNLSPRKIGNPLVANTLRKIIQPYDVISIQEIQDKSERVTDILLGLLDNKFDYVLSPPTGRTAGECEQYATFYKKNKVKVINSELYPDPNDIFTRNPHLVQIRFKNGGKFPIMLVNLHAKPDASSKKLTVKEISGLTEVYDYIKNKKKVKNVLLMGDWNAGGRYVRKKDWACMAIRQDPKYNWLIKDKEDTTVGNSKYAYDRIVAVGEEAFLRTIQRSSARVDRFNKAPEGCCKMTQAQALKVSDHYPVQVTINVN